MFQRANTLALLIAVGAVSPTFAWNALGHKVVAEIAWRELDPATRQSIVDTLRRHPRFDADVAANMTDDVLLGDKTLQDRWIFQHAAYWPDIARGLPKGELEKYNRPTWHYVTNPLFLDGSDRDSLMQTLRINNTSNYPTDIPPDEYNAYQTYRAIRARRKKPLGKQVEIDGRRHRGQRHRIRDIVHVVGCDGGKLADAANLLVLPCVVLIEDVDPRPGEADRDVHGR